MDMKELLKQKLTADNFYVKHFMEEADGYYDEKDDDGKQVYTPCHKSKEELLDNAIDELINDKTGYFEEFVREELSSTASELVRKEIEDIRVKNKINSHIEKVINSYKEKGIQLEKDKDYTSDFGEFRVKVKIGEDFYLTAQGGKDTDYLFCWTICKKDFGYCYRPEQIAEFLKLIENLEELKI